MGRLTFLTGGARSGKSALAARCADGWSAVTVIVTAESRDGEMAARIARHRAERPSAWHVIEEPRDLPGALLGAPRNAFVIVDCLTVWVANLLESGVSDEAIVAHASAAATAASRRDAPTVIVSNEVGGGIVPVNELARRFRDVLGRVNAVCAAAATDAFLVVAGRVLRLERIEAVGGGR